MISTNQGPALLAQVNIVHFKKKRVFFLEMDEEHVFET